MSRLRRAKLALDAFRNFIPKASIRQIGSPISQKFGFPNGACRSNQQHYNPFLGGAKRFYCVDRNQVLGGRRRWFQDLRDVTVLVLLGSWIQIVITVYFWRYETIPYTKPNHFVLFSMDMERKISKHLERKTGEKDLDSMKEDMLPAFHPENVRVRLIAKEIIEALQKGLQQDVVSNDLGYGPESDLGVIVVDKPTVYACCLHGGKIVVHTGMLKLFKTDAEVAVILAHEDIFLDKLAHAVARHPVKQVANILLVFIPLIIHFLFLVAGIVNTISNILLRLPFSLPSSRRILLTICVWLSTYGIGWVYLPRKMEQEADYIGMLLLASAGYDPRVAPKFYRKLGDVTGDDSFLHKFLSDHPSGKKRAQLLSQSHVMQEALNVYRQAKLGRAGEGFL